MRTSWRSTENVGSFLGTSTGTVCSLVDETLVSSAAIMMRPRGSSTTHPNGLQDYVEESAESELQPNDVGGR